MMGLIVCPLDRVQDLVAARRPSHVITLLDPDHEMDPVTGPRHLRLGMHDVALQAQGLTTPEASDVERVLEFIAGWDQTAPLLVHCHMGISRSTATAFIIACQRSPDGAEHRIAQRLRAASPQAYPNRRLIALGDAVLGRRGRMIAAVQAMGGNSFVAESVAFDFPARHA